MDNIKSFLASLPGVRLLPKPESESSSSAAYVPVHTSTSSSSRDQTRPAEPIRFFPSSNVDQWLQKTIKKAYEELMTFSEDELDDSDEAIPEIAASSSEARRQTAAHSSSSSSGRHDSNMGTEQSLCMPVEGLTKKMMGRKGAQDAWKSAHNQPVVAELEAIYKPCKKSCHLTGHCAKGIDGYNIVKLRKLFHGSTKEEAPKDKERGQKIMHLIQAASKDQHGNLSFDIDGHAVCAPTFLRFLGVFRSDDMRDAPRQWNRLIAGYLKGDAQTSLLNDEDLKLDSEERFHKKEAQVTQFADEYCRFFSDCIPIAASVDENGATISTVVVPFRSDTDFYHEFVFFCQSADRPISVVDMASETTFRNTIRTLKEKKVLKYMGGKSGIPTCAVCNNMKAIKKSACCRRDEITRQVLIKLARLHLLQQKAERQHAENFMGQARKLEDGQPVLAYADIDGQSVWTGNTPRIKIGGRTIKTDHVIENRNIGVRVVCGPIDEYISVSTNNLIPGGANVLVEVTRYTISYIGRRLAEYGMLMPKNIGLQFDNSGENKNKEMFCFLSETVEECYFDCIEVFFLLVGHTHNILDQWFGVLATAIQSANFIGSVLALHELYKIAHAESSKNLRPKEVYQLEVYHDWRKRYAPVVNNEIHNYSVPLRWRLTRDQLLGVAKCDYQVVSPTAGFKHLERWQPESSQVFDGKIDGSVELTPFMTFNGPEALFSTIGIETTGTHSSSIDLLTNLSLKEKSKQTLGTVASVLPVICQLEVNAIGEQIVRNEQEARDDIRVLDTELARAQEAVSLPADLLKAIDREITRTNSEHGGRIVWLRRSKIADDPDQLHRRPDVLPNPQLWKGVLAAHTAQQQADQAAGVRDNNKGKPPQEVTLADTRLTQFRSNAIEMASASVQILHMVDETKQISISESNDIVSATSRFSKPVLTRREIVWYRNMDTVNKIVMAQEQKVVDALAKPWQLLDLPEETPEQKKYRVVREQQRALIFAQTEARLRKTLLRPGEGEYQPDLQVVAMDGFRPAKPQDLDDMNRPKLEELAKQGGMKSKDIKSLKVDDLRATVKKLVETNPNLIQIPGVEIVQAESSTSTDVSARTTAALNGVGAAVLQSPSQRPMASESPNDATQSVTIHNTVTTKAATDDPHNNGALESHDGAICSVVECEDSSIASFYCNNCQLPFCEFHKSHAAHSLQAFKSGRKSNSDWSVDRTAGVEDMDLCSGTTNSRNRGAGARQIRGNQPNTSQCEPPVAPLSTTQDPGPGRVVTLGKRKEPEPKAMASRLLEGDNPVHRQTIIETKLAAAVSFILEAKKNKTTSFDELFKKFNFQNSYDSAFLCMLSDQLGVDVSRVTMKSRYSHKELLCELITQVLSSS